MTVRTVDRFGARKKSDHVFLGLLVEMESEMAFGLETVLVEGRVNTTEGLRDRSVTCRCEGAGRGDLHSSHDGGT
jgi:hypothetical protein